MDWNKAIQYAQLVNAAYDVFAGKAPITPGYDLLATIYANDLATDSNPERGNTRVKMGLILQAQDSGEAVVAIRGTEGIKEWVQDAQFLDEAFTFVAGGGRTEDGFTDMYRSMSVEEGLGALSVVRTLGTVGWKRDVSSFTICGHSLGGAIATLLALDVAANTEAPFNNPTVYTYASPRTGDHDFAVKYHQTVTTTYRFVDTVDLVPKLPGIFPYRHVTDAILLDSLTLIPPRVRLQPNPLCWHILSSYLYLVSLYSGGAVLNPEAECAPAGAIEDILGKIETELNDQKSIADMFTASPRRSIGGTA
ncbi:MAG TPA: lipase family protein [Candidatus Acidoferrum sp.]|nr:lipase family protein [Candidatus Acidoferrum sp.]